MLFRSEIMKEKGLVLEEYIDFLREYPFEGAHLSHTDTEGRTYDIYYVASGSSGNIPIPAGAMDTAKVSGNNIDGYIVTVPQ